VATEVDTVESDTRAGGWARRGVAWFTTTWDDIDATRGADVRFGRYEAGLLVVASAALAIMRFPAQGTQIQEWLGVGSRWYELGDEIPWALFAIVGYVVVPLVYLRATGRRVRDLSLGWAGTRRHLGVYAVLAVLMIVPVVIMSGTGPYQALYPFYELAGRSWLDFLLWESAYCAQFFALEFFFRGFMLEGLRRPLGHAAIFVMVVPYCAIHFNKTFSESMAAIVAGVVLGTMAMKWRSIWGGALLHCAVAVSMDVAMLTREGLFPPP